MHLIWQEASKSKNGKAPHAAWCNYDDLNEYFWLDHRFCFSYCFVILGKGWWTNCAPSLFHILFYFVITTNNMFQVTWLFHFGLAYEWQCRVLQVYPWSYSYSTGETSLFSATICFFDKYNRDTFLYQIKWRRKATNQNLACIYHLQIQCYGYIFPHIKVELNYLLINLFIHFSWKGVARGGSGKSIGKSNFVETRTFWHIFRSFDRLWTFYILALQVIRFT